MSTVARVPVLLWGWADYLVLANAAGRHVDDVGGQRAPVLLAIGVAAPGQKDMSALAVSYDTIPVKAQAVASATGGVVVGGVIGGVAGWPGWLDAVAAVGLGVAGAAGLVAWYRSRIGNRRLSYRLPADDPTAPALLAALAVLMKLGAFLVRFDADIAKEAKHQGVQPIALDPRTRQVPVAIHRALWELGTETTRDTADAVLTATRSAASAAVADVYAAWRAFDSFLPAVLPEPELTVLPEATPAKDLQDLADALEQERAGRQLAVDDVQRINIRLQT